MKVRERERERKRRSGGRRTAGMVGKERSRGKREETNEARVVPAQEERGCEGGREGQGQGREDGGVGGVG